MRSPSASDTCTVAGERSCACSAPTTSGPASPAPRPWGRAGAPRKCSRIVSISASGRARGPSRARGARAPRRPWRGAGACGGAPSAAAGRGSATPRARPGGPPRSPRSPASARGRGQDLAPPAAESHPVQAGRSSPRIGREPDGRSAPRALSASGSVTPGRRVTATTTGAAPPSAAANGRSASIAEPVRHRVGQHLPRPRARGAPARGGRGGSPGPRRKNTRTTRTSVDARETRVVERVDGLAAGRVHEVGPERHLDPVDRPGGTGSRGGRGPRQRRGRGGRRRGEREAAGPASRESRSARRGRGGHCRLGMGRCEAWSIAAIRASRPSPARAAPPAGASPRVMPGCPGILCPAAAGRPIGTSRGRAGLRRSRRAPRAGPGGWRHERWPYAPPPREPAARVSPRARCRPAAVRACPRPRRPGRRHRANRFPSYETDLLPALRAARSSSSSARSRS